MIRIINLIFFIIYFSATNAYSLIEIDITRGNLDPLPIAVSPLFQDDGSKKNSIDEIKIENVGSEISSVVENNLKMLKDIVKKKSAKPLKFKDGRMKVDLTTASTITQVYDKVNASNKKKIENMINGTKKNFLQISNAVFKLAR